MALLNNYYVFVKDENVRRGVSVTRHPVEKGLSLTDNVKREPTIINLQGEIVGSNSAKKVEKITALMQKGNFVKYVGCNILNNALITSFDTDYSNTIYGGCAFNMEITEVRIAKSPLVTNKNTKKAKNGTQQVKKKATKKSTSKKYTVKRGDTLWAIAKKYYGNGAKYTKIVNANKSKIKNPDKIQVGWVLTIPA